MTGHDEAVDWPLPELGPPYAVVAEGPVTFDVPSDDDEWTGGCADGCCDAEPPHGGLDHPRVGGVDVIAEVGSRWYGGLDPVTVGIGDDLYEGILGAVTCGRRDDPAAARARFVVGDVDLVDVLELLENRHVRVWVAGGRQKPTFKVKLAHPVGPYRSGATIRVHKATRDQLRRAGRVAGWNPQFPDGKGTVFERPRDARESEQLTLSREAASAGLAVTRLAATSYEQDTWRYSFTLWGADGELWAEANAETAEQVRGRIASYQATPQEPAAAAGQAG